MKAVRLAITGRVQGVGYRWWTVSTARRLGLGGWVRNERDGSVSAHVEGEDAVVDALIEACRSGPAGARVTNVAPVPASAEDFAEFSQH